MDLQKYRAHPGWQPPRTWPWNDLAHNRWRVFTKFRAFLLWFAGFYLGMSLTLILWGAQNGRTASMIAPIGGCVVAILFLLMAVRGSPKVDEQVGDEI